MDSIPSILLIANSDLFYKYEMAAKLIFSGHVARFYQSLIEENPSIEKDPVFNKSFSTQLIKGMDYGFETVDPQRYFARYENIQMQTNFCESCGNYSPQFVAWTSLRGDTEGSKKCLKKCLKNHNMMCGCPEEEEEEDEEPHNYYGGYESDDYYNFYARYAERYFALYESEDSYEEKEMN